MMDIEKRLSKAKTQLILDHPFIGNIAMNMPFRLDESCPTAMTNGEEVVFNPKFVAEQSDDQLIFLVAHECSHPLQYVPQDLV